MDDNIFLVCICLLAIVCGLFLLRTNDQNKLSFVETTESFNDTVLMVQYDYSWWGLGGVSSTTVTFENGVNATRYVSENISILPLLALKINRTVEAYTVRDFVFQGNYVVSVGDSYHVEYKRVAWSDGKIDLEPISITKNGETEDKP